MKTKKISAITAAAILMVFTAATLSARRMGPPRHDRDMRPGPGHHRGLHRGHHRGMCFNDPVFLKEKLKLTDKQINAIADINLKYEKEHLKYREKMEPKKIRLRRLLIEDNIDLKKVRAILTDISSIQVEIRLLRIKQRIELEKVLTSEQREKLKAERGSRPGRGKGRGMGPR